MWHLYIFFPFLMVEDRGREGGFFFFKEVEYKKL